MSRLEGGLHGLKARPSARSDDQDFRHGVMLLVGLAWLIVMCNAGSRTARRAGRLHMKGCGRECAQVPTMRRGAAVATSWLRRRRLRWLWRECRWGRNRARPALQRLAGVVEEIAYPGLQIPQARR